MSDPITTRQLLEIENTIDEKLNRIEFLDDNNPFENDEILVLKDEVRNLISYLRRVSKVNRIVLSGLRLI